MRNSIWECASHLITSSIYCSFSIHSTIGTLRNKAVIKKINSSHYDLISWNYLRLHCGSSVNHSQVSTFSSVIVSAKIIFSIIVEFNICGWNNLCFSFTLDCLKVNNSEFLAKRSSIWSPQVEVLSKYSNTSHNCCNNRTSLWSLISVEHDKFRFNWKSFIQ